MSNIIDSIQVSGVTYQLSGSSSGGNNVVELTQAQYDALVDKDPTAFYIITDATAGDLTQYWTSAQTQSAITSAVSTKQDTLVSGTNIKTINNESILGSGNIDIQGGGSSYTAGRGIDITNDTISVSLPISAGTGNNSVEEGSISTKATGAQSHAEGFSTSATSQGCHSEGMYSKASNTAAHSEGNNTTASGTYSHAEGGNTTANGQYGSHAEGYYTTASGNYGSHAEGRSTNATNESEHASGRYNISSSASATFGDSGNTLFSVGNGTADNARHNAFEIRQNGDIYITLGGQDVKLQDHLGGGGGTTYSGVSGITINNNNEIYYDGIYKTWLTSDHSNDNAVYWFKGSNSKIWIDDNEPSTSNSDAIRHQFSFGAGNNLKGSIGGVAFGQINTVKGFYAAAFGQYNNSNNTDEFTIGQYNVSSSASTTFGDSGNTLFSVGNGTADNARHNAFEIRQNGDIYITLGGQDVKLQDYLGGGGSLSGYVTTDTAQDITAAKTFLWSDSNKKPIIFKQTANDVKLGFLLKNSASTNNELATFELRPNTFTIDNVQHPLLYFGHYRNTNTANAGVPQTVIGFRQYDQYNGAAYHYLMPLPEKAKTPFSLTTTFKDYYAPIGFKNGSTMITADNTGVVDLSSELDGLKLKKLTQAEYDALSPNYDSNTLYVIVN